MAFEVPLVLRNLQITGRIIGIGAGGHFFKNANNWFTELDRRRSPAGTGFIWSLVVLAVIAGIVLLPDAPVPQGGHRRSRSSASTSFVLMFVFGLLATSRSDFQHNLPHYTTGSRPAKIAASGSAILPGHTHNFLSDLFSTTVFPFMLGHRVPAVHRLPVLGVHLRRGARERQARRHGRAARRARDRRARELGVRRRVLEPHRLQRQRRAGATTTGAASPTSPLPLGQPQRRCRSWR